MKTRLVAASVALALVGVTGAVLHDDEPKTRLRAAPARPARPARVTLAPTTTLATTTTTATTVPPTVAPTAKPAPATAKPVVSALKPAPTLRTNAPLVPGDASRFAGFGAWIDVYDWSREFTGNKQTVGVADIDRMAGLGVQTLYVQASKWNTGSPNDIVDRDLLDPLIARAHKHGMRVVAWYLPTLEDPATDLRRMLAMHALGVEGIVVDIESRKVEDVAERNRRLVDLSIALRQRLPNVALGACVMPSVILDVINPHFWPAFPFDEIAPAYDAWMPMNYWSGRTHASGYRDAYRYSAENIDRLRTRLNRPDLPVHLVGGIGDGTTTADVEGFYRASAERHAIGGSLYDYRTTADPLWPGLQKFRR